MTNEDKSKIVSNKAKRKELNELLKKDPKLKKLKSIKGRKLKDLIQELINQKLHL